MAAPIQQVANTVSFKSSKSIFNTGTSSHMTPDRRCFRSFLSVRGNAVLTDMTQVEYTSIGLILRSCRHPSGDISMILFHRILFVPS
jgi:hypothetical protein